MRPAFGAHLFLPFLVEAGVLQLLAEWREVGRRADDHALLGQEPLGLFQQSDHVAAHIDAGLVEAVHHQVLHVLRQPGEGAWIDQRVPAVPDMAGQREILLDLEQPVGADIDQRPFLALHHAGLQRGIEFREIHRRRRGADRPPGRDDQRARRRAQFESLHVRNRVDRLRRGRHLVKAAVEDLVGRQIARLLQIGAQQLAQLAVHRLPDRIVVLQGERHAWQRAQWRRRRGQQIRQHHHLHAADPYLGEGVEVGAELTGMEDGDLEPAVGFLLHPLRRFDDSGSWTDASPAVSW